MLVSSVVDIQKSIVPLEVCWFVSLVGLLCATAAPHPWVVKVSPVVGAMGLAAVVGLVVAIVLVRYGLIQRSFIDAEDTHSPPAGQGQTAEVRPPSVACTRQHGVNPRKEALREVLFLAPALVLAVVAYLLVSHVPSVEQVWSAATGQGTFGRHFNGFLAAMFGYLIGGAWIWATRILGTLAFGKEAMGLGDVHIMAAVGAVVGWIVPSIAFFVAPFFGLLWALYLLLKRNQRELPYGPWLAAATLVVLLFYDAFAAILQPYGEIFASLAR